MNYKCPDCGESFGSSKARGTHRRWHHERPWADRETLYEEYVIENKSTRELANQWGCGGSTISEWVDRFDLKLPYNDKDTLRDLYVDKELTSTEIAERFNTSRNTVLRRLRAFGIETREVAGSDPNAPYKDEDILREEYVNQEIPAERLALKWGCSTNVIWKNVRKFDLPRQLHNSSSRPASEYSRISGRVNEDYYSIAVHRLVAYAHGELDFDELFDHDIVIHHKDEVKWNNSPDNLQAMKRAEHTIMHMTKSD